MPGKKSNKRPLTAEELEMARKINAAISESGNTQDEIAGLLGVTQGVVTQWATGRTPVAARRATALARLIKLQPEEISVAYRALPGASSHGALSESSTPALSRRESQLVEAFRAASTTRKRLIMEAAGIASGEKQARKNKHIKSGGKDAPHRYSKAG